MESFKTILTFAKAKQILSVGESRPSEFKIATPSLKTSRSFVYGFIDFFRKWKLVLVIWGLQWGIRKQHENVEVWLSHYTRNIRSMLKGTKIWQEKKCRLLNLCCGVSKKEKKKKPKERSRIFGPMTMPELLVQVKLGQSNLNFVYITNK